MAMVLHYSSDTPPESMFTDIQALNNFTDEQFIQLLKILFDFLLEPSKSHQLLACIEDFAQEHQVSAAPLRSIIKSLLTLPTGALKKHLTPKEVKEDLCNLGLSDKKADYFAEQWKINFVAMSRMAVSQTLMVNQLINMEWKFGVTAASSEVNKVGNTFLQLKLVINKANSTENIYMELTLPQFYAFLHEMEKAKSALEYFS